MPDNAPLFRKLYAFMISAERSIHNMPREYRYTLGAEISKISWKCLDLAVLASYAEKTAKLEKISELSSEFDRINLRIRALQELKIISAGQLAHWQENYLFEIGKQIGGWLNWAKNIGGGLNWKNFQFSNYQFSKEFMFSWLKGVEKAKNPLLDGFLDEHQLGAKLGIITPIK